MLLLLLLMGVLRVGWEGCVLKLVGRGAAKGEAAHKAGQGLWPGRRVPRPLHRMPASCWRGGLRGRRRGGLSATSSGAPGKAACRGLAVSQSTQAALQTLLAGSVPV